MRKLMVFIGLAGLLIFISACGNETAKPDISSDSDNVAEQTSEKEEKVINGMKITIENQEVNDKIVDGETLQLYTFTITGKNMSSMSTGLGSIDFILKTKEGDIVEYDHSLAMFGNEILTGESLEGQVSFVLDKEQEADKLVYRPGEEELAEWDVY